jgi:hypothetical protein
MTVESAADRASLLADFGVVVTWKVGEADAVSLTALFDGGAILQVLQDGGATNTRATLTLRAEDLPAGAGDPGDVVTVNTVVFHPKAVLPDGQGMVIVQLEQDDP